MSSDLSPSNLRPGSSDEIRLRTYRNQLEQKNQIEIRDMEARHAEEVQRLMETQTNQIENLRHSYDVSFSEEAQNLNEKLIHVQVSNEERLSHEKESGVEELQKLKTANNQRLEEYRKNGDLQIEAVRKQLQATSETLHEAAKKAARKEREVAGS